MNVLIICQHFPPENEIGSIRPSRIAKYLNTLDDITVTVLTVVPFDIEKKELSNDYYGCSIIRVKPCSIIRTLNDFLKHNESITKTSISNNREINAKHSKKGIKAYIRKLLFDTREKLLHISYLRNAKTELGRRQWKYDVLLSTYNTEFGHKIALWCKKKHPDVKWIADFRDSTWNSHSTRTVIKQGIKFVKKVSRECDAITVVSQSIIDIHKKEFGTVPIYLITNGYDHEDISRVNKKMIVGGPLRIVYTGDLYNGRRDLTPLFHAITKLFTDRIISPDDIEIIYAGKSEDSFCSQIANYKEIHYSSVGFLSRDESLSLQANADILLLASWCEPNEKSVLTGKFFEYLQMEKPIICVVSGTETGSELSKMIHNHKLGICYEAATHDTDFVPLCRYLEKTVLEKKNTGKVAYQADEQYVFEFDYEKIANKFYDIMKSLYQHT